MQTDCYDAIDVLLVKDPLHELFLTLVCLTTKLNVNAGRRDDSMYHRFSTWSIQATQKIPKRLQAE